MAQIAEGDQSGPPMSNCPEQLGNADRDFARPRGDHALTLVPQKKRRAANYPGPRHGLQIRLVQRAYQPTVSKPVELATEVLPAALAEASKAAASPSEGSAE